MAIIIAGVIGGIVIIGAANHDDHSDYNDWHDYSDFAERTRREREAKKRAAEQRRKQRIAEARENLGAVIDQNVTVFENQNEVQLNKRIDASDCSFVDFDTDMQPLDNAAQKAINKQVGKALKEKLDEEKAEIAEINQVLAALNKTVLNGDSTKS